MAENSRKFKTAPTPLAQALYAKRQECDLSMAAAAAAIGVSLPTVWRMETRGTLPTVAVMEKAAKWLDIPVSKLIPQGE